MRTIDIVFFAPHGVFNKAVSLGLLVSNYFSHSGANVTMLRCNGAASACSRDASTGWKRNLTSCPKCMIEQKSLSDWASLKITDISTVVPASDLFETRKWLTSLQPNEISNAEFRGMPMWKLVEGIFSARFGEVVPRTSEQMEFARGLVADVVQLSIAAEKVFSNTKPELVFVAGDDHLSEIVHYQAKKRGALTIRFEYSETDGVVRVHRSDSGVKYEARIGIETLTTMRRDHRAWSSDIIATLHEMLGFLGFGVDRVPADIPVRV